jgi:hypothetical protein
MILRYLLNLLPFVWPWILSLVLIGSFVESKSAEKILKVGRDTARRIAAQSLCASLLICLPIALLVPIWSGLHLLAYFILAVGVQYYVVRKIVPELDSKVVWSWSWRANGVTVGWSVLAWVAMVVFFFSMHESQPDLNANFGPGGSFDQQKAAGLWAEAAAKNQWFKIPSWYAGRWRIVQKLSAKRDGNRWTKHVEYSEHVEDFPDLSTAGHYADKTGQVWECEQAGESSSFDSVPSYFDNGMGYRISKTPTMATDSVYSFKTREAQLILWKGSRQIGSAGQQTDEVEVHPIAPNQSKTKVVAKVFDWRGNHLFTKETEFISTRIADFAGQPDGKTPDGKPLFPLFIRYLNEHGMSDRIPPSPSGLDPMAK